MFIPFMWDVKHSWRWFEIFPALLVSKMKFWRRERLCQVRTSLISLWFAVNGERVRDGVVYTEAGRMELSWEDWAFGARARAHGGGCTASRRGKGQNRNKESIPSPCKVCLSLSSALVTYIHIHVAEFMHRSGPILAFPEQTKWRLFARPGRSKKGRPALNGSNASFMHEAIREVLSSETEFFQYFSKRTYHIISIQTDKQGTGSSWERSVAPCKGWDKWGSFNGRAPQKKHWLAWQWFVQPLPVHARLITWSQLPRTHTVGFPEVLMAWEIWCSSHGTPVFVPTFLRTRSSM